MKQTKIVASVSDRRCDVDFIRQLYKAGVNVVRMNTAHATEEGIKQIINNVRAVSPRLGILIDTKGPEVRTTGCSEPVSYKSGEMVEIYGNPDSDTCHDIINVSYPNFASDIKTGCHILFDDGALDMVVTAIEGKKVVAEVQNDGVLGSHKSVNVPGVHIELPALTEKDKKNILLAIDQKIDFIAHSFVRSASDVTAIQEILDAHGSDIKIIAKIENQEGVDNIDEILHVAYGIMIARGDLGIEVPIEQIPSIQRAIIRKCRRARKPVIVATQMLHSMISNPRPTRAEVTDIANAVFSCTDALMLSGETASGKYPIEAVEIMAHIAEQAECDKEYSRDINLGSGDDSDIREYLAQCAINATETIGVNAILIDSGTGQMARNLAAFRGPAPIIAICYNEPLIRSLNLSYGVHTILADKSAKDKDELFQNAIKHMMKKGFVDFDDSIVYLTGSYFVGGVNTMLKINTVREALEEGSA